jgi:hypothetical protein
VGECNSFMTVIIIAAEYLTRPVKLALLVVLIGLILYSWFLYYQMIAEVKVHAPETRFVLLALCGLFPVFSAHRRIAPQSKRRLKMLLCILAIFVLFILSDGFWAFR